MKRKLSLFVALCLVSAGVALRVQAGQKLHEELAQQRGEKALSYFETVDGACRWKLWLPKENQVRDCKIIYQEAYYKSRVLIP
jgi:hypothetical protein